MKETRDASLRWHDALWENAPPNPIPLSYCILTVPPPLQVMKEASMATKIARFSMEQIVARMMSLLARWCMEPFRPFGPAPTYFRLYRASTSSTSTRVLGGGLTFSVVPSVKGRASTASARTVGGLISLRTKPVAAEPVEALPFPSCRSQRRAPPALPFSRAGLYRSQSHFEDRKQNIHVQL